MMAEIGRIFNVGSELSKMYSNGLHSLMCWARHSFQMIAQLLQNSIFVEEITRCLACEYPHFIRNVKLMNALILGYAQGAPSILFFSSSQQMISDG